MTFFVCIPSGVDFYFRPGGGGGSTTFFKFQGGGGHNTF